MPVEYCSTLDKIVDYIPDIINKAKDMMNNKKGKTINIDKNDEDKEKQTFTYTYTQENIDEDE